MGGQSRIRARYLHYRSPWHDYLFVTRDELRGIVRDTGWTVTDIHDGPHPRYAFVLEKVG